MGHQLGPLGSRHRQVLAHAADGYGLIAVGAWRALKKLWGEVSGVCRSRAALSAAGLLGLLLGRFWDRISESSTWRPDTRVRCYEELAGSYYQVRDAIRALSALEPASPESDLAISRVLELGAKWERDIVAVWLHGSESVTRAVKQLDNQITRLFVEAPTAKLTLEQWRQQRAEAEEPGAPTAPA